jgi:hypothetical protein
MVYQREPKEIEHAQAQRLKDSRNRRQSKQPGPKADAGGRF